MESHHGAIAFELVTPERLELSMGAQMVTVPGAEGEFGVLPGHAPFVSTLKPGIITAQGNSESHRIAVVSGIAEVTPERCVILAERARDLEGLTRGEAEASLATARKQLDDAITDEQKAHAASALALAEVVAEAFA